MSNTKGQSQGNRERDRMIELSRHKGWTLVFMTLTTGVYFASETLQLSPLISDSSHYTPTVYTFSYDLLYSWLVRSTDSVLGCCNFLFSFVDENILL